LVYRDFLDKRIPAFVLLALLCVAAYAPLLSIPLIEDDYGNLAQAEVSGRPPDSTT
jgi:hypothetical protein